MSEGPRIPTLSNKPTEKAPSSNVHDFATGEPLTKREVAAEARIQQKTRSEPTRQVSRRNKRFIDTTVGKIATGAAALATGALFVHEGGKAYDALYEPGGPYYIPPNNQELITIPQQEEIPAKQYLDGTMSVIIKTDDGKLIDARSAPEIPDDDASIETNNKIDWSKIMAIKTGKDNPEVYIHGKNSFAVSGIIKFVDGYDPVIKQETGGLWTSLIGVMSDGTEQKVFLNKSAATQDNLKVNGTFTNTNATPSS